jgi:PilZ domain
MTESHRASQAMGMGNVDQRRSPRKSIHAGGTISAGDTTHVAWIKDVNDSGICLFTKHSPQVGEVVHVTVNTSKLPPAARREYEGKVIRVQSSGVGAAVRVAITFSLVGAVLLRSA